MSWSNVLEVFYDFFGNAKRFQESFSWTICESFNTAAQTVADGRANSHREMFRSIKVKNMHELNKPE